MMIQFFLTALLAGVATLTALQRTTSRFVRVVVLLVIVAGAYLVWAPEQATVLAGWVGVGRGADLILYLWVVITLALIVFLYLKTLRLSRKLTLLTRHLALMRPEFPRSTGRQDE
jgi:hypothetical protein